MPNTPETLRLREQSPRRFAFLVSTTGWANGIQRHLGSAGYSYFFAYEALRPVLESFGTCRLVEAPESRLPFLADEARASGLEPIHLAINPPQDVYLTPSVPTVVYPFWEFPDVPDRDFGLDTRQNWTRVLSRADAIAAPCGFTGQALAAASGHPEIPTIPVPLRPDFFDLPDWNPSAVWSYTGRHTTWTRQPPAEEHAAPRKPRHDGRLTRLIDSVGPRIGPRRMQSLYRWKQRLLPGAGESFSQKQYKNVRHAYNRYIRRWLSDDAISLVTRAKRRALKTLGVPEKVSVLPGLPTGELTLGGLVYTTIFNVGDPRKNQGEILSAFLMAFRDRDDVTLVIKLVTNPVREHHEVQLLQAQYDSLGIDHACKVVVITSFLSDEEMAGLFRATTYYVNHSFGEGACLPLQQALAGGRPALAPDHSAMSDYISPELAFVTRSSPEPTHWPHDPEKRVETYRYRPLWADLHRHFLESAEVAEFDRDRYQKMAEAARERMKDYASRAVVEAALARFLDSLPRSAARLAWDHAKSA